MLKPNETTMKRTKVSDDVIEILNDLIKINNDRIKGYEKAIENTETPEAEVKTLYARMAEESYDCIRELSEATVKAGGTPATDTTVPGKIYHASGLATGTYFSIGQYRLLSTTRKKIRDHPEDTQSVCAVPSSIGNDHKK